MRSLLPVLAGLLTCACSRSEPPTPPPVPPPSYGHWIGQWAGPEGTSLAVTKTGDVYTVSIRDLDRSTTYKAEPVAEGLQFERRGQLEVLHATDGPGTGMKWLAERRECLTVNPGEGFCRD